MGKLPNNEHIRSLRSENKEVMKRVRNLKRRRKTVEDRFNGIKHKRNKKTKAASVARNQTPAESSGFPIRENRTDDRADSGTESENA